MTVLMREHSGPGRCSCSVVEILAEFLNHTSVYLILKSEKLQMADGYVQQAALKVFMKAVAFLLHFGRKLQ